MSQLLSPQNFISLTTQCSINQSINQFIINNHQTDITKVAKRMLFKTVAFAYGTWT